MSQNKFSNFLFKVAHSEQEKLEEEGLISGVGGGGGVLTIGCIFLFTGRWVGVGWGGWGEDYEQQFTMSQVHQ